MVLKNKPIYPQIGNLDDQIVATIEIAFDIFLTEDQLLHVTMTANQQRQVGHHQLTTVAGQLQIDAQPVDFKQASIRIAELLIVRHSSLTTVSCLPPIDRLVIAADDKANLQIQDSSRIVVTPLGADEYQITLMAGEQASYLNQKRVTNITTNFAVGDQVLVAGLMLERRPHQFKITDLTQQTLFKQLRTVPYQPEYPIDFPDFRRSPRIMLQEPKDKITINQPENLRDQEKNDLFKTILPPLGMLTASFATAILSGRNPVMMLGMGSASLMTMGISISSFFTNKKTAGQQAQLRTSHYQEYIVEKVAQVKQLAVTQRHALAYHYPAMPALADLILNYSPRIYEKTSNHQDYLKVMLGTGAIAPSFKLDFKDDEQQKNDPLMQLARETIVEPYQYLQDAPVTTSLLNQTIGLVGVERQLREVVQALLLQIATFHSYHDVEMLALVPEQTYATDWAQWRWLPHFKIHALNLRGIVHNIQTKEMVVNSFYQLLNKRRQLVSEKSHEQLTFSPHYILTILDDSWLAGHGLNEFLAEDMSQYGVTVIWGKEGAAMLPETVTTLIEYDSLAAAKLINEDRQYVAKSFKPYRLANQQSLPVLISHLANLNHLEVEKNAIPESVTFLGMYDVQTTAQLAIAQRWQKANTSKSLAVPLGLRGKDELVYLNLHERAHGPHGLVAGTTGSGKSETVQSYLLSLAVNFAPEDVGFLPIDFKGGGMANLFAKLPHLLGAITNLDGASSARALASIRAELQKRQRLFGQFGVNHINGYTKLYKAGKLVSDPVEKANYPTKPLPHLFLVSDEFAELKANEPEFMAELVSTARIGRSLGVHLILATQKPSGVVDDQIWSNSRFKLALKVQDVADSNEILKTPDAASIVEPGRAYLQVGNNEIYELFQSAWSGAKYDPNQSQEVKIDERLWLINDYGQTELLTADLSEDEVVQVTNQQAEKTQLEAIVDQIAAIATETKAVLPDKPWLPPLANVIATPQVDFKTNWQQPRTTAAPLGLLDVPSKQAQVTFDFDLETQGNTLIYSSPGFGKTTALQTLLINFAKENTPAQMQFNLLDFGTNGLLPLKDLPHVADLVNLEQVEKLTKMLQRIREQLDDRKQAFQQVGVASLTQYEMSTKKQLPIIVNVIDSYDAALEDHQRDAIDSTLMQVLREGNSLGIYLVMTTSRSSGIRMAMLNNMATQLPLFLIDNDELRNIMGREYIQQQVFNGRGQLAVDEQVNAIQIYTPNPETETLAILQRLKEDVTVMTASWQGERPSVLPIVPSEFELAAFNHDQRVVEWVAAGKLPLGLALSDTAPLGFIPDQQAFFLIAHSTEEQLANIQKVLFAQFKALAKTNALFLVDLESELKEQHDLFNQVFTNDLEDIAALKQLMADYVQAATENQRLESAMMYIADLEQFFKGTNFNLADFKLTIQKGRKAGLSIIIQSPENYVGRSFDPYAPGIREIVSAGLVMAKLSETNLIQATGSTMAGQLAENEAYYFESKGRKYAKMRFAGQK